MKIKNDIKLARLKKDLTQEQLALLLRVDVNMIEAWENGDCLPNLEERRFLSDILDIRFHRSPKLKNLMLIVLVLSLMAVAFALLNLEEKSWSYVTDELDIQYRYTVDEGAIELKNIAYRINEEDIEFKIDARYEDFIMVTCFNRDAGYVRRSYMDEPGIIKVRVAKSDFEKLEKLGISLLVYSDKGNGEIGITAEMFIYWDDLLQGIHEEVEKQ